MKVTIKCDHCSASITRNKHKVYAKNYCNDECRFNATTKLVSCHGCGKEFRMPISKVRGKNHCNKSCMQPKEYWSWIGWMVANSGKISRVQAAKYMEMDMTLLKNIMNHSKEILAKHGMRIWWLVEPSNKAPKTRGVRPKKEIKDKVVKSKRKQVSGRPVAPPKPEPKRFETKKIQNPEDYHWVRIDNKTMVMRLKPAICR